MNAGDMVLLLGKRFGAYPVGGHVGLIAQVLVLVVTPAGFSLTLIFFCFFTFVVGLATPAMVAVKVHATIP